MGGNLTKRAKWEGCWVMLVCFRVSMPAVTDAIRVDHNDNSRVQQWVVTRLKRVMVVLTIGNAVASAWSLKLCFN